ncbi:uncharacterized protein C12orf29 homolog [Patella vulgata]|uniref:uncharacterized protein C12orf29 homolog n=1 Tax=Patella vulgata TaxID=6465 RepID=UPI0024A96EFD|nr:uncharacterized protein C12orf29 homolog [Patella vulgata]XP_050409792.2 uncharacterized protein C12orf29 homolog [Patella vulgata]XP_055957997.1 uncharacterized protein C12orf29 homolog [Patella vulgata]
MEKLKSVQQKIPCIFEISVINEPSDKRSNQPYKVVAGEKLNPKIKDLTELNDVLATEKLDGTCVLIDEFNGKPWLWARYDRKPTKGAEKRFRKFQNQQQSCENRSEIMERKFEWDFSKDFKDIPDHWKPASGVDVQDGHVLPDSIGHTPGWVPVDVKSRQHCWHLTSVDLQQGLAVVLRETDDNKELVIDCVLLETLLGHTAELIGTMVNGNPYGIGSKQCPVHILVIHGSIPIYNLPSITRSNIQEWFLNNDNSKLEGIVWHFPTGQLYKLHRNHLGLEWPIGDLVLSKRPVSVSHNFSKYEFTDDKKTQFYFFSNIVGHRCEMLKEIHDEIIQKT